MQGKKKGAFSYSDLLPEKKKASACKCKKTMIYKGTGYVSPNLQSLEKVEAVLNA